MTINEAARRIVERVNANRAADVEFRRMGVLARWTMAEHDDITVILDTLVLSLQVGIAGRRERIYAGGEPTEADVERIAQRITDYFRAPVYATH